MPVITVSTCGTSILRKWASRDEISLINKYANAKKEEYPPEVLAKFDTMLHDKLEKLLNATMQEVRDISAELNGFIAFYDNGAGLKEAANTQNMHFLIQTDTYQGHITAELIQAWGEAHKINMQIVLINDLNTKNINDFRFGINNLVEWCSKTLSGLRSRGYKVIFNLVGAFKALQGYMQTLGMFYADETIYIFEGSSELLRIPRMPVDFEANAKQAVIENARAFRLMQQNGDISIDECGKIPDTMIEKIGDRCCMSEWGKIIWSEIKDGMYSEAILPPTSERIIITRKAQKQIPPNRYELFNRAIEKLSRYLETGGKENVSSLDFKQLIDSPIPPSTHEFDLWPDMGGWRGFCHYENNNLVIDSVGMGLGHV